MSENTPAMQSVKNRLAQDGYSVASHHYPQIWFLILSFAAFGIYVAWDLAVLRIIVQLDRSYISLLIAALVILATCHAGWNITRYSRRIEDAYRSLSEPPKKNLRQLRPETGFINQYLRDLDYLPMSPTATSGTNESDSVIEIYADKLRSPVELGWFLVDLAVRLGLLGTIIGFILIFTSLSGSSISGTEGLKELLVSMSGGMGTALFTTLSGLVGGTLLSFQYLILGREVEHLIGLMIRLRNRHTKLSSR